MYLHDITDLSVGDGDLHAGEVGVEPPLQGGHELNARGLAGVDGLDSLGHVCRDGLLAEYVLAVRRARFDLSTQRESPIQRIVKHGTMEA